MNNFLQKGRRLLLPLFVVLLLGLSAIPTLAAETDTVTVDVTVEAVNVVFVKNGEHPSGATWASLLALPDLTLITFTIGQSEIEAGQAFILYGTGTYKGRVIWRSNGEWYMKVKRGSWSPDLDSYGLKLWLKSGGDWTELTTSEWTFTQDSAAYGSNMLDWKLDKNQGDDDGPAWWNVPPDTYTTKVTFTMYAN